MSKDYSGITDEYVKSIEEQTSSYQSLNPSTKEYWEDEDWDLGGTHALFVITSPNVLDDIIQIDDEISFHTCHTKLGQKITIACVKLSANEFYPVTLEPKSIPKQESNPETSKPGIELQSRLSSKERETKYRQFADALTKLRVFLSCCNLISSYLFTLQIGVPQPPIRIYAENKNVPNLMKMMSIDTAPNTVERINQVQISYILQEFPKPFFKCSSVDGYPKYSLESAFWHKNIGTPSSSSSLRPSKTDIKNGVSYYTQIKAIIQNMNDAEEKRGLIIALNNYQLVSEQSLPTQSLNYLLLRNTLESIFLNQKYPFHLHAIILTILEQEKMIYNIVDFYKMSKQEFEINSKIRDSGTGFSEEDYQILIQVMLGKWRNEIAHGSKLVDYYDKDQDLKSHLMRKIVKTILIRILTELDNGTPLNQIIKQLRKSAKKRLPSYFQEVKPCKNCNLRVHPTKHGKCPYCEQSL
ncbi:MAG: hypothetical protein CL763_08040 [Chloroflexi bacterium]|nr:hypothetical protein [Chloroflexota bacterium]|tara:strand:- start:3975 stop:5378 length:1404 start_codon:yes stop_codon:yes gene_type:complete